MEHDANIQIYLAARAGVYRILQNLFGNEPSFEGLENLLSEAAQITLGLFAVDEPVYAEALDALLRETREHVSQDRGIERLRACFTQLFVGPGAVEAAPWESIYRGNDNALFQSSTLEVRRAYLSAGFLPQSYPKVADDHIALELDFMACLAKRLVASYDCGDDVTLSGELAISHAFLSEHLLVWTPSFAAAAQRAKHSVLYAKAAHLLTTFLPLDAQALNEVIRP
jgi:TorA maturation chaperone TorD